MPELEMPIMLQVNMHKYARWTTVARFFNGNLAQESLEWYVSSYDPDGDSEVMWRVVRAAPMMNIPAEEDWLEFPIIEEDEVSWA